MLETPTAIANAEAIAAVPGVDILLIGTKICAPKWASPETLATNASRMRIGQ
jgi:2-keto-3-deoxy-L-rhamnonate aldolase RhmA